MSSALITLSPIRFREKVHHPTVVCTLVSNCFIIVFCVSLCYRNFAPPPPQVLRCWMKFQRWATQKRAWPKRCKPKMFVNTWPIAPTWKTNRSKCLDWRSTELRGEWKLFANFHLLYPIIYNKKNYHRQPEFCKWAFNVPRGQPCLEKWDNIPAGKYKRICNSDFVYFIFLQNYVDLDLLITHTPPLGHGDLCCSGVRAGCVELLSTVQKRVKPKYHVFGHIHEGNTINSITFKFLSI